MAHYASAFSWCTAPWYRLIYGLCTDCGNDLIRNVRSDPPLWNPFYKGCPALIRSALNSWSICLNSRSPSHLSPDGNLVKRTFHKVKCAYHSTSAISIRGRSRYLRQWSPLYQLAQRKAHPLLFYRLVLPKGYTPLKWSSRNLHNLIVRKYPRLSPHPGYPVRCDPLRNYRSDSLFLTKTRTQLKDRGLLLISRRYLSTHHRCW